MGGILSRESRKEWLGRSGHARRPSQTVLNSPGAIQVVGDENIVQLGPAPYRIEYVSLDAPAIPDDATDKPSALLGASYQVVPFSGRTAELRSLTEWRDSPRLGQAVRLIYGPAGQGKTRLAAEFAMRSAGEGWVVAGALHGSYGKYPAVDVDRSAIQPASDLLVIVDYAERWPRSDLLSLIQGPLLQAAPVLRVLLLARSAGWWWDSLRRGLTAAGLPADHMSCLAPLADTAAVRVGLFTAARDRFAELLGVPSPAEISPPHSMRTDDAPTTVLTVHMTALAAVHARLRGDAAPSEAGAVSAYLLDREREHWERLQAAVPDFTTPPLVMARVVYAAILIGRVRRKSALAALESASIATAPEVANQILDNHILCYPPSGEGLLEPLYPDRLGEDFLGLLTPGHSADYPSDDWADEAIITLLRRDHDQHATEWAQSAVPVLIEAARRWPHLAVRTLYPLLLDRPDLAVVAGGQALTALAALPGIRFDVLAAVERQLPGDRRIDLDVGIAAVTSKVAEARLAIVTDVTERAGIHRNLGWRLANAGLYEDAVNESGQAVRLYEELGSAAGAEPDLARALGDLGNALSGLGLRISALANFERVVQIYSQLLAAGHSEYEPLLAESLTYAARELWYLDQGWDALARAQEAVGIYRKLASREPSDNAGTTGKPPDHRPQLARALLTLGTITAAQEGSAEGIASLQEAIGVSRQLVEHNPYAHEFGLAQALNNLSVDLAALGQHEAALTASEEAVEIGRRLAKRNPAVIQRLFALWLRNLSHRLREVGRLQDALAMLEDAVAVRRLLAQANPTLNQADLAADLDELSVRLAGLKRYADARAAGKEARAIQAQVDARAAAETSAPDLRGVPDTDAEHLARLHEVEGAEEAAGDDSVNVPADLLLDLPVVEPVESAIAQATGEAGQEDVLIALASAWIYALGNVAGDTSVPGRGTASDLLHFTIDTEAGTEVTMLPVFTRASTLRTGLLRNPEWQELSALEVDGDALLANIDDDVAVVINPWTDQEFLLPSRLAARRTDSSGTRGLAPPPY
jgi:tetratricopeptide (TPR) repeat protein